MTRRAAAVAFVAGVALAGCGGDAGESPTERGIEKETTPARTTTLTGGCTDVSPTDPREPETRPAPTTKLDPAKRYELVFDTNCGEFTVRLDLRSAPRASASIVALARADFFDRTLFHRIVPGFVIQGGDPTASGTGGPGYSTVDPPPQDARYTRGVVAMAKTATEAAGTAGSQFFVVTAEDAQLPPQYAVLGRVVAGMRVVGRIGRLGDPETEQPTRPVIIRDVSVRVS